MHCFEHGDREAVGACARCHRALCHDCAGGGDRLLCRRCEPIVAGQARRRGWLGGLVAVVGLVFMAFAVQQFWSFRDTFSLLGFGVLGGLFVIAGLGLAAPRRQ